MADAGAAGDSDGRLDVHLVPPRQGELRDHGAPAHVATPEPRPLFTIVPAAKNVVPFRSAAPADKRPSLTPVERSG